MCLRRITKDVWIDALRAQLSLIHPLGDSPLLDRLARSAVVQRVDGTFELSLDPGVPGAGVEPINLAAVERDLLGGPFAHSDLPLLRVECGDGPAPDRSSASTGALLATLFLDLLEVDLWRGIGRFGHFRSAFGPPSLVVR